jgi:hypothetical protein
MPKAKFNRTREKRIRDEIVVDMIKLCFDGPVVSG